MGLLRLLLAFIVLNEHSYGAGYTYFIEGGDAVRVFFAISGFYMAMVLNGKYKKLGDFYINRYLRLYPSYLIVLVCSIGFYGLVAWYTRQLPPPFWIQQANQEMALWQWFLIQFSNLTMLGLDIPPLFHWSEEHGFLFFHSVPGETAKDGAEWVGWMPWIRHGWSIGAELWFYMLAPFLVRRRWEVQGAIALASLGIALAMEANGYQSYFFFPANLWMFLVGSLLFACYPTVAELGRRIAAPVLGGVILICCFGGLVENSFFRWGLLLLLMVSIVPLFAGFSKSSWDNAIGELSYPVYLWHLLVIMALEIVLQIQTPIASAAVAIALSLLLVRFVEEPMNRFRQRRHLKVAQSGQQGVAHDAPPLPDDVRPAERVA